jgi:hypothetical protein
MYHDDVGRQMERDARAGRVGIGMALGMGAPGSPLGRDPEANQNQKMPDVTLADVRLHEGLHLLADNIQELEVRLQDVLRPGLEKGGVGGGGLAEPRPVRAPLAERLGNAADRLASLAMQVRSILGRLEV